MKLDTIKILSTFFGIGYLPFCPGTWASLAGVGIYLLLGNNSIIYGCIVLATLFIGFLVAKKAEERFGQKDSHFIVIDEVAAVLILLIFTGRNLFFLIAAFLIFRGLDIIKPYPIKKIENFPGSWGIMLDDLVASFYTIIFIGLMNLFIRR